MFLTGFVIGSWHWIFQMWPYLIQKAKAGGFDVIQTYVFWNGPVLMHSATNFGLLQVTGRRDVAATVLTTVGYWVPPSARDVVLVGLREALCAV